MGLYYILHIECVRTHIKYNQCHEKNISVNIAIHLCKSMYVQIHRERERERERQGDRDRDRVTEKNDTPKICVYSCVYI